ncbi:hypothetical protein [Massilia sp. ST3]|uniref:hypothetical protein n=1 Tax=Massilia sp. ST3 TaxID=2824903 RepID=UPI001B81D021|nr:hypothetical protein [Massilia sp. ST3]MBQ5947136.1 hypothetical protein [Massilia sp. ST3]
MNDQHLTDSLAKSLSASLSSAQPGATAIPARADIVALRQLTRDETRARINRFLNTIEESGTCPTDRAHVLDRGDRSLVHLPEGARATVYHASGALEYRSGLAPFAAPFERLEQSAVLVRRLGEAAERLKLASWSEQGGSLAFERLWQTKAQGADREERVSQPLLVRATGAWRHAVAGIPVLGAASAALTLAGDGRVDGLSVNVRPLLGEVLDSAPIIGQDQAIRQVVERLIGLLGRARDPLPADVIDYALMQFGYLDTGRRKSQRLLAPAFVAQIALRHKQERQAYVIAVHATARPYMELPLYGVDSVLTATRGEHCKPALA